MAIHVFCQKCKTSSAIDAEKCSRCGVTFGRRKKYRVCASVKGKRATQLVDNLTIAREIETTLKADLLRDEYEIKQQKVITLGDLWDKHYLPWAKQNKKSWIDERRYYQKHLQPRFADKRLDAITALDLERLKSDLKKGVNRYGNPYAPGTIKHQLVIIRRLFNLASKWGFYDGKNPVKSVTLPKIDNQVTEYLTDEQLRNLLDTLDVWPFKESAQLVKFALFSGFRRGEIFKLMWDDVDFDRGLITLRGPKGGKSQTLPVSEQAMDVLREVVADSPYVFPGKNGQQRKDFKGPWGRIRKAAGLPDDFRFHGLRHHFASTLVSNGVDLAIVKELLTHKDLTTTQRYAHLAPDAVKRAALQSGKLLQPKKKVVRLRK